MIILTLVWKDIQPVFNEYKAVTYVSLFFQNRRSMLTSCETNFQAICIIMTSWKQLLEFAYVKESVLFRRHFIIFCTNWIWGEYFLLCILLTQILQRKEFECYFLKKKSANYRMIAQIFSRNQILSVIRKTSAAFCNGKYSVLNNFCYAEFLAYYTLHNKSICEYKTD